jgi:hypothetical protein
LRRSSLDLFHGTNFEIPFWVNRPAVLTVHHLSSLLHHEKHEKRLVRRAALAFAADGEIGSHDYHAD